MKQSQAKEAVSRQHPFRLTRTNAVDLWFVNDCSACFLLGRTLGPTPSILRYNWSLDVFQLGARQGESVTTKRPIDLDLTDDEERILATAFRENHEVTQRYMGQITKGAPDRHIHNEALLKEGISTGVLRAVLELRGHNVGDFTAEYQPDTGTVRITKST